MVGLLNAWGALLLIPFQRKQDAEILSAAFLPKKLISNPDPSLPCIEGCFFFFYQTFVLPTYLPKWPYHFELLWAMAESSCWSTSSSVFSVVSILDFCHFNRCVWVSHFNLHSPDDISDMEHFFICLFSCGDVSVQVLPIL